MKVGKYGEPTVTRGQRLSGLERVRALPEEGEDSKMGGTAK